MGRPNAILAALSANREDLLGGGKMKKVVVTGGSGFVGRHLIDGLLRRYPEVEITSISRSEGAIARLMTQCCSNRLTIVVGDVREPQTMRQAIAGADTVVHLAAMKRVEFSEQHCCQAVTTNVIGTINALAAFSGETFALMSTDKAVEPTNCYGATKFLAEKLVLAQADKNAGQARFMAVRSGNITGSTGSVLEIWKQQIASENEITVTDPRMTRLFVSIDQVVALIIAVLELGENGKIYVTPRGEGVLLGDFAQEAIKLYGDEYTRVRVIGKRPGEKLHEKTHIADEPNIIQGFERRVTVVTPEGASMAAV
jgi:UDP-N-acetylglucosamine 4,6-dehydratase